MCTVAFRADGGQNLGLGHIMRCLSLAKELRKNRYQVYFFSKFPESIQRIKEENFKIIQLSHSNKENVIGFNYGTPEELNTEAEELIRNINKYKIDFLFIDTYNVTEEYFLKIKPHVKKLAYIDDLNKFVYPVDILINGNITSEYMNYKKYSKDEIMLLKPKYNLIRDEFRNLPRRKINKEVKQIMITTGGSDPYNMTTRLLNMLLRDTEIGKLKFNIIVGNDFTNKEDLIDISKKNSNVILYKNVKKISQIMLKSDIAISSGGSTLYELCACGTPTLGFIYADNQEFIVKKMNSLGYIINLEWYKELCSKTLTCNIKNLMKDFNLRKRLCIKGQDLVDAKGVQRIVDIINNTCIK